MNRGADRNVAQGKSITDFDRSFLTAHDFIAGFQAFRSDDVAAFAVLIEDESDVGGAVRIVFETFNNSGNTVFIALEVDDTVGLLVAAALMTNSDTAEIVTTGSAVLLFYEGCKRFAFVQFRVHNLNGVTTTGRCRFQFNQSHYFTSAKLIS